VGKKSAFREIRMHETTACARNGPCLRYHPFCLSLTCRRVFFPRFDMHTCFGRSPPDVSPLWCGKADPAALLVVLTISSWCACMGKTPFIQPCGGVVLVQPWHSVFSTLEIRGPRAFVNPVGGDTCDLSSGPWPRINESLKSAVATGV